MYWCSFTQLLASRHGAFCARPSRLVSSVSASSTRNGVQNRRSPIRACRPGGPPRTSTAPAHHRIVVRREHRRSCRTGDCGAGHGAMLTSGRRRRGIRAGWRTQAAVAGVARTAAARSGAVRRAVGSGDGWSVGSGLVGRLPPAAAGRQGDLGYRGLGRRGRGRRRCPSGSAGRGSPAEPDVGPRRGSCATGWPSRARVHERLEDLGRDGASVDPAGAAEHALQRVRRWAVPPTPPWPAAG